MANDNALKFSDLFDLGDKSALDQLIKSLEKVGKAYEKQVEVITKANKDLMESQKEVQEQAKKNGETIKKLNPTLEDHREKIEEIATNTDQLSEKNEKYNDQIKKNGKSVDELNGKLKENKDSLEKLKKVNTQLEKLQMKLNEATSEEAFELEKVRQQLNKANKDRREATKEALGLVTAYQKESKRLNELRNAYKNQRLEFDKNTKGIKKWIPFLSKSGRELRKLKKDVNDLDGELKDLDKSVGQNQREVGNYELATGKAKAGFNGLVAVITGAFLGGIVKTRKQTREFEIFLAQAGSVAKTTFIALADTVTDIVFPKLQQLSNSIKSFGKEAKLFFIDLIPDALKDDEDFTAIENLTADIKELELANADLQKTIDEADDPWANFGDTINNTNDRIREQLELDDDLINKTAILSKQINDLQEQEELLQITADDTTLGFQERIQATLDLIKTSERRASLEADLARQERDSAVLAIKNDLEREGSLGKVTDEQIRNLSFLKDRELADNVSIENLQRLQGAVIQLADAENDLTIQRRSSQKLLSETFRDNFEIERDFANDAFDVIKTVNEQKIADDTRTLDERFQILNRTVQLGQESFDDQVALVEDFRAQRLAIEKGITKDQAQEQLQRIDFNQLVLEDDQRIVRERLRSADIDEITLKVILDIFRERQVVVQDLTTAERELNAELKETTDTLARDLALLRDAFAGEEFQIDTTQLTKLLELRERLNLVDDPKERAKILEEVAQIEKQASDERLEIVTLELEGKKSILENELELRKKAGDLTVEQEEDLNRQIADIDQELLNQKIQINNEEIAEEKRKNDEILALQEQRKQEILRVSGELALEGTNIVNAQFQREIEANNNRLAELERRKELEVALAGDNADRRAKIELEFFRKEEELRARQREALRKQAIFEKTVAIAQITIQTAQAIARTLAEVPKFDFGVSTAILVGLYTALGAAQIGTVLATPIPEFWKGTDNAPEGPALVDERGPELHLDKSGRIKDLGSDKGPRIKFLEKGDKIIPHGKSRGIIDLLTDNGVDDLSRMSISGMESANGKLSKVFIDNKGGLSREEVYSAMSQAMDERPVHEQHYDHKGFAQYERKKNSLRKKLNDRYRTRNGKG